MFLSHHRPILILPLLLWPLTNSAEEQTSDVQASSEAEDSWEHELDLGINGATGNSQAFSLHAGFKSDFTSPDSEIKFKTAYDRSSTDGEESRNQFFADLLKNWLLSESPWFFFSQGRYDWDRYKDWDYRIALSGGAGYQFVKNSRWDIYSRAGLGGNRTYGGDDEEVTKEALLGFQAGWTISDHESLVFDTTFYPSLEEDGAYRNITTLDWKLALQRESKLAMKIGLSNEYDSEASGDEKRNNFKYYLSLVWGL
jgi:putative salt-induced outer membrane protein YdiY